jgi:hypothetical protein
MSGKTSTAPAPAPARARAPAPARALEIFFPRLAQCCVPVRVGKFRQQDADFQRPEFRCQQIAFVNDIAASRHNIPTLTNDLAGALDCPRSRVKSARCDVKDLNRHDRADSSSTQGITPEEANCIAAVLLPAQREPAEDLHRDTEPKVRGPISIETLQSHLLVRIRRGLWDPVSRSSVQGKRIELVKCPALGAIEISLGDLAKSLKISLCGVLNEVCADLHEISWTN